MAPSGAAAEEDSDGELSDSARAVLALQRDLKRQDADEGPAPKKARREDTPGDRAAAAPASRGGSERGGRSLGDSGSRGAITGVRLGEFAPGAKPSAPRPFAAGGPGGGFGQSLESLASRVESDDESARALPEAPVGSYRRRDAAEAEGAVARAGGKPRAKLGIDGKVWDFVGAGSEEASGQGALEGEEGQPVKRRAREEKSKKRPKQKKKDKQKKTKDKQKKKKAKTKKNKKKKKRISSSSSGSSSS